MNLDSKTDSTYNSIDLAKIICAILVITIHVAPFGTTDSNLFIVFLNFGIQNYLARIAVPFFFVSSGFLLFRKTSPQNYNEVRAMHYMARILRLYLIWTFIYFPIILLRFFKNKNGILHAVLYWTRDVIFTGSYVQLWYFPALIFAVFLVSLLLSKKICPKSILILSSIFYFIGLFGQSWFGFILPLKQQFPDIWSILQLLQTMIVTTRDGLFEAFFFVSMGMCLAFYDIRINPRKALGLFFISMWAMLVEVFVLQYCGFIRAHDMYFFLGPVTFFLFCFIIRTNLPNNPVYKTMRLLSSLIFYTHMWVNLVVEKLLSALYKPLSESCFHFILTLLITIVSSYLIIKLSECQRFNRLKLLYA